MKYPHIDDGINSYLQVTNGGSGNTATDGVKFGMLGNTPNAIIAQQESFRLLFTTAGAGLANSRMCILGAAGPTQGFVGIGAGFISPGNLLDVNGGDIDVNTPQKSYMIGDNSVLWHKGDPSNIFVGVGAGQSHPLNSTFLNTFVGNNAGFANTTGQNNTLVGATSGSLITTGFDNSFLGVSSGTATTIGGLNVFLGYNSAPNNTSGSTNVVIGPNSGGGLTTGAENVLIGFQSATTSFSLDGDVFING